MMFRVFPLLIIALLLVRDQAIAQTTQPHRIAIPDGFVEVAIAEQVALCEPADEAWVRETLSALQSTTRPSTMPADLLERAAARRDETADQLAGMLGLDDASATRDTFDQRLLLRLKNLSELRPPIFFLVTSSDRLRSLVKGGWSHPHLRYNRAADQVSFEPKMTIHEDGSMDDVVWPVLVDETDSPDARGDALAAAVRNVEMQAVHAISGRGQFIVYSLILQSISEQAFVPLELEASQQWLALGVAGALAARFSAPIIGMSQEQMIAELTAEHPRSAVKAASIDLTNPPRPSELRPQYVPLYLDALRRKSVQVADDWIRRAGDDAITRTLIALREKRPSTGAGLIELIRETSGIDLSEQVKPQ